MSAFSSISVSGFAREAMPCIRGSALNEFGTRIKLCDIGANICDDMYSGVYNEKKRHPNDLLGVLQRSRSMNVHKIICTAGSLEDAQRTLRILSTPTSIAETLDDIISSNDVSHLESLDGVPRFAESYGLFMTVGVHPTRCSAFTEDEEPVEKLISDETSEINERSSTGSRIVDSLLSVIHFANYDARSTAEKQDSSQLLLGRGRKTVVVRNYLYTGHYR